MLGLFPFNKLGFYARQPGMTVERRRGDFTPPNLSKSRSGNPEISKYTVENVFHGPREVTRRRTFTPDPRIGGKVRSAAMDTAPKPEKGDLAGKIRSAVYATPTPKKKPGVSIADQLRSLGISPEGGAAGAAGGGLAGAGLGSLIKKKVPGGLFSKARVGRSPKAMALAALLGGLLGGGAGAAAPAVIAGGAKGGGKDVKRDEARWRSPTLLETAKAQQILRGGK